MKEIKIKLPDWVDPKKTLMLISGKELVWLKTPKIEQLKKERCNQCGECCMDFPPVVFGCDDEGKCNKLEKQGDKWVCVAGSDTPKRCLADPEDKEELGCSIRYYK
ncbi:MAG: hypothetical protein ACYTE8_02320 [Planctomycetota bacterium]|jgi:hypothetical protein